MCRLYECMYFHNWYDQFLLNMKRYLHCGWWWMIPAKYEAGLTLWLVVNKWLPHHQNSIRPGRTATLLAGIVVVTEQVVLIRRSKVCGPFTVAFEHLQQNQSHPKISKCLHLDIYLTGNSLVNYLYLWSLELRKILWLPYICSNYFVCCSSEHKIQITFCGSGSFLSST